MFDIAINVTGRDKSGKGHIVAAVAHALRTLGADVTVQLGETHNAPKLAKTDEEIAVRLSGVKVAITEQQT